MTKEEREKEIDSGLEAGNDSDAEKQPRQRMRKKKALLSLGALAVVVCLAAGGMLVWHEQPSFCSSLCHPVMSPYVESWETGSSLAHAHAEESTVCLDCHDATIEEQFHELQVFLAGSYRTPLALRSFGDELCENCHERDEISTIGYRIDYSRVPDDLLELLEEGDYDLAEHQTVEPHSRIIGSNPNNPHVEGGQLQKCSACHSMHKDEGTSLQSCYSCHHTRTFAPCKTCHN